MLRVTEDWLDTLSCARQKIYSVTTVGIHIHQCNTMVCKTAAYIEYISAIEWCVKLHNSVLIHSK